MITEMEKKNYIHTYNIYILNKQKSIEPKIRLFKQIVGKKLVSAQNSYIKKVGKGR